MPFIGREVLEAEAERLGINLNGLSWPEQQKKVQEAMKNGTLFSNDPEPKPKAVDEKSNREKFLEKYQEMMVESYKNAKPVRISAEIKPMRHALYKYDEDLGDALEVEDVSFFSNGLPNLDNRPETTATYVVKGKTGRKQIATSTLPRENVQIVYDPNGPHWLAPIVTDFQGKEGYIWSHPKYGGIKRLLIDSGYFEEYRDLFRSDLHPNNIWMAGGKFFVANIQLCERIFKEIEKKAKKEAEIYGY